MLRTEFATRPLLAPRLPVLRHNCLVRTVYVQVPAPLRQYCMLAAPVGHDHSELPSPPLARHAEADRTLVAGEHAAPCGAESLARYVRCRRQICSSVLAPH